MMVVKPARMSAWSSQTRTAAARSRRAPGGDAGPHREAAVGPPDGAAFPPLDRFVMELFRTISPNAGSLSSVETTVGVASRDHSVVTPHPSVTGQEVAAALIAAPSMTTSRHSRNRSSTVRPGWK
jgi:hypothetical protein